MKTSYLFLAEGFEEIEALAVVDVLRRAEIPVKTISIHPTRNVRGAHSIEVVADATLQETLEELNEAEYLILPGGLPGTTHLDDCEPLCAVLGKHYTQGGKLAAICAAPMVLGRLGILQGKRATCYPGFESYMEGAIPTGESVTVCDTIITGNGPGAAIAFALALVEELRGEACAVELSQGMQYPAR